MRRFIICTDEAFPRGSAGANYLLYFAKALQDIGYFPIIIAYVEKLEQTSDEIQEFEGIAYIQVAPSDNKIKHFLTFNFFLHQLYLPVLQQMNITREDIVWLYSAELSLIRGIKKFATRQQATLGACVVEWYTAYASKSLKEKIHYFCYKKVYKKELVEVKNLLPISHWLQAYYGTFKTQSMVLPIMTEVNAKKSEFCESEIIRFIYPGGKSNKDDVDMIITTLSELGHNYKYEIHLTGIVQSKEEFLKKYPINVQKELRKHLQLHGWMNYEELERLYDTMDFLVLIREESSATLANFPSKIPETMSHGIIPIVSDIGDYGQILSRELGKHSVLKSNTREECQKVLLNALKMNRQQINENKYKVIEVASRVFDYHNYEDALQEFLSLL